MDGFLLLFAVARHNYAISGILFVALCSENHGVQIWAFRFGLPIPCSQVEEMYINSYHSTMRYNDTGEDFGFRARPGKDLCYPTEVLNSSP